MNGRVILLVTALATGLPALGQEAPPPTRDAIDRGLRPAADPPVPAPKVDARLADVRLPCLLAEPAYRDLRFKLASVRFEGTDASDTSALAPSWAAKKGQTVAAADICEIRDEAARILNAQGYIAAVEVPAQQVGDGVITLNVLFLRMTGITVTGVSGRNAAKIHRVLQPLLGQPRFNSVEAERALLLAQDLPGLTARMTLRPVTTARGDVVGDVAVHYRPVALDAGVINTGPASAGPWGVSVNTRISGVFGLGDRTSLGVFMTAQPDEQQVVRIGQEFQLNDNGLTVAGEYTAAWSRAETTLGRAIDSDTSITRLEMRAPLARRQARSLSAAAGFELIRQQVDFGIRTLSLDRLKFAYVRGDFDASGSGWRAGGSLTLRQGLGTVTPEIPPSRFDADPRALIVRGVGYGVFDLTPRLSFSLAPRLQYSPDSVPTFELMTGGNYTIGRGFDPGSITGDSGVGVAAELRFGALRQRSGTSIAAQPYVFVDVLRTWTHSTLLAPASKVALASTGVGVRLNLNDRFRLDAAGSLPVHSPDDTKAARFLLSLSLSL